MGFSVKHCNPSDYISANLLRQLGQRCQTLHIRQLIVYQIQPTKRSFRICFCLFLYLTSSHSVVLSPTVFPPPVAGPHPSTSSNSNQSNSLSFPNHFSVSSANT